MARYSSFLITGVNGFTGGYLVNHLRASDDGSASIIGMDRHVYSTVKAVDGYICCDIENEQSMGSVMSGIAAEDACCYHLAGVINPTDTKSFLSSNVTGTYNALNAFFGVEDKGRFVNIGSSAEYGYQGDRAIDEGSVPNPTGWYGLSKSMQTMIVAHYAEKEGLDVVMTRTFNLIGPGQSRSLVVGKIVAQAAECKLGRRSEIEIGDTSAYRDFVDIRDAVSAYRAVCASGRRGEIYNVGSGCAVQVQDILEAVLDIAGIDVRIVRTPQASSRGDIPYQCASIGRISEDTGWRPTIPLRQSLLDMLDHAVRNAEIT